MIYYICDREDKVEHCFIQCGHGLPHKVDCCSTDEVCYIECEEGMVVRCRPATKKELEHYKLL